MLNILLKIEERFSIRGRGLLIIPVFPTSATHHFEPFDEIVLVITPDRIKKEFNANFHLEHFSMQNGSRQSAVLLLPDATIEDIPGDSELIISADALNTILDPV